MKCKMMSMTALTDIWIPANNIKIPLTMIYVHIIDYFSKDINMFFSVLIASLL